MNEPGVYDLALLAQEGGDVDSFTVWLPHAELTERFLSRSAGQVDLDVMGLVPGPVVAAAPGRSVAVHGDEAMPGSAHRLDERLRVTVLRSDEESRDNSRGLPALRRYLVLALIQRIRGAWPVDDPATGHSARCLRQER